MVDIVFVGLALVLVGFAILMVSMMGRARGHDGQVKGGGVVMIGPIPIIFGSDGKWASLAIVLAIVLVLVYLLGALL